MTTLKAMFKLFDGYSTTVDKINKKTDDATNKILKASGATDKFNSKLNATGASANTASGGLGKFLSVAALVASALKGINIVDEFTNTSARLNLINDGLQTQAELQNKIFAAADRSRGAYSSMADAVAKLGLNAGESFGSTDEMIAFTELMQKSFKVGGADSGMQSAAMLQLTQAMSSGRLQGDEFTSITENAPLIKKAIGTYMRDVLGMKAPLKELASEGVITSDVIKNALFMASEEINAQFKTMPMTFADYWNQIKNGGMKAFVFIMEKVNNLINTDGFQQFIDGLIIGFDLLANTASWLINTIISGWGTIGPILGIIAGVLLIAMITNLWAMVPPLIAQAAAWLSIYWPLLIVIGVIAIAISAARQFGASWEQIFGFIGGVIGVFATSFYNRFVFMWNMVAAFINFIGNVFNNPVASIKALFLDLASNVIGYITTMAKAIENVINKIPGVEVNISGGLEKFKGKLEAASANIKSEAGLVEYVKAKDFMDYSDGYTKGSNMGKSIQSNLSGAVDKLTKSMTDKDKDKGYDMSQFGTSGNPLTVKGKGKGDKVEVDMSDEDLQYLRDIAERDYINKFSTATLAPNIKVTFGDVHETADADKLMGRVKKILQEEIAMSAEGAY